MGHKPVSVTPRRERRSSVCAARTRNSNAASSSSFPIWPCSGTGLPFLRDYSCRMRAFTPPFHPYLTNQAVSFLLRFPFRGIWSAAPSYYGRGPCSVGSGLSSLQCKATAAPSPFGNIRLFSEKTTWSPEIWTFFSLFLSESCGKIKPFHCLLQRIFSFGMTPSSLIKVKNILTPEQ